LSAAFRVFRVFRGFSFPHRQPSPILPGQPRFFALFQSSSNHFKANIFPPKNFVGNFVVNFVETPEPPPSPAASLPPPLQSLLALGSTARFSRIFKAVQSNSKQTFPPLKNFVGNFVVNFVETPETSPS
jgi:hypothetical protein